MDYFPFQKVRLPPKNVRRARLPALLIFPCLAVFVLGLIFRQDEIALSGFTGASLAAFTTFVLLVPVISASILFMLAPTAVYILADFRDYPIATRWWFWALCMLSISLAVITLKIAGKLYPRTNAE